MWQFVDSPFNSNLHHVNAVSSDEIWVGGERNTLFVFDGKNWHQHIVKESGWFGSTHQFYYIDKIFVSSNGNVWVAGTTVKKPNIIAMWDRKKWHVFPLPVTTRILDMQILSDNLGWAVGLDGVLIRWNGNEWQRQDSLVDEHLTSIYMHSSSSGWAVGHSGSILKYEQSTWSIVDSIGYAWRPDKPFERGTEQDLLCLDFLNPETGYIGGINGTILKLTNEKWEIVTGVGGPYLSGRQAISNNRVEWEEIKDSFKTPSHITSMSVMSSGKVWAVGGDYIDEGAIFQFNGTTWRELNMQSIPSLSSISMLSDSDGWIVGNSGCVLKWKK